MGNISIMSVFGTRPEAIKMAPVVLQLQRCSDFVSEVVVTAQHRELLDQVLSVFHISPQYDLNIMTAGQSLTDITVKALTGLEKLFSKQSPDMVLVHGDTTTTFAASVAAFYANIPVGHVEAGLRTGDPLRPFPEEMNRRLTGNLAKLHFAPTSGACDNLLKENVDRNHIFITGNTAIDSLKLTVTDDYEFSSLRVNELLKSGLRLIVVDAHRRESFGKPMEQIARALADIVDRFSDVALLVSLHPNPKAHEPLVARLKGKKRVVLHESLDYPQWVNLLQHACLYVGDSGGLQEEAPALGLPVVLLREVTERPEAVAAGTVIVAGCEQRPIVDVCTKLLTDQTEYDNIARAVNPYGDGRASDRILQALQYEFGLGPRPADFTTE